VAKFFAHLLSNDAVSWEVFQACSLTASLPALTRMTESFDAPHAWTVLRPHDLRDVKKLLLRNPCLLIHITPALLSTTGTSLYNVSQGNGTLCDAYLTPGPLCKRST